MFDCIPKNLFEKISLKILHGPCLKVCNHKFENILKNVSQNKFIVNIIEIISYFNVSLGYGFHYNFFDKIKKNRKQYSNINFYSTEANRDRLKLKYKKNEDINKYIIKTEATATNQILIL